MPRPYATEVRGTPGKLRRGHSILRWPILRESWGSAIRKIKTGRVLDPPLRTKPSDGKTLASASTLCALAGPLACLLACPLALTHHRRQPSM
jgi:hypothetical protein